MPTAQLKSHLLHNRNLLHFVVLLVTVGTDQTTKFLARQLLVTSSEICVTHCFLFFSLIENHGGFLGIVNNLPENIRFLLLTVGVSFFILGCLIYLFIVTKKRSRYDLPLVFVAGGGMSNLLDRILHNGGVTDFVSIGIGHFRTGLFNLADIYILLGSFVFGFIFFSSPQDTAQPQG